MKLKTFKQYITEEDITKDNMLRSDIIKSMNAEFYDISPKDEGQRTDIKEMFAKIQVVLDGYDIIMIGDDFKPFNASVITTKGQANVLIAPKENPNPIEGQQYHAYDNAVLDVKWNTFGNEYALKSVSVKERK